MPHGPTGSQRFVKALIQGQTAGPLGEKVQQRRQYVTAVQAAGLRALVTEVVATETGESGLHSPESGTALAALAKAYQEMEDYPSALEYFHLALICREQVLPAGDLVTLNTMESIAIVFELATLWDDALAYWRQFHEGLLSSPKRGPNHPTTLATRFRIARAKSLGGMDDEALTELTELLSLYDGKPNGGGAERLKIRWERAKVLGRQGQYADALGALAGLLAEQEALETSRNEKFGSRDRRTMQTRETVAGLKRDISALQKKQEEASRPRAPQVPPKPSQPPAPSPGLAAPTVDKGKRPISPSRPGTAPSPSPGPSGTSNAPSSSPLPDEDASDIGEIQAYHAELVRVRAAKGNLHPETLDLMYELAKAYASHDKHESAINWFKEALAGRERNLGPSNPVTAATEFHLAKTYIEMGEIVTALAHFERVLASREAKLGPEHPETLATVLAIGSIYSAGPYQDHAVAVKLVQRAVTGFLASMGASHSATLNAQFQLAEIHVGRGHIAQGIQLHEQVLALRQQHRGEHQHSTLASKYTLAALYWKNNGPDNEGRAKAVALFKEAFHGRELLYSRKHSATSRAASQLAEAYWTMERWQDALECYTWVLEGIRHRQPNSPMATLTMLNNIAACHARMDDPAESLEWLRKVLALHEIHTPADDPVRIAAVENVATMCMRADKEVEAVDLFAQVVAARGKAGLADSDEAVSMPLYQLCACTFQADQRQACVSWTKRFLAVPESAPGVTVEMRLIAHRRLGMIHLYQKQADEAVGVYQPLLEQARAALAEDHWLRKRAAEELAVAHRMRLAETDAIADLHARRERIKRLLDTNRPVAIMLLAQIADAHLQVHEYSEAAALYEEVLDFLDEVEARRRLQLDPVDDDDDAANAPDLVEIRHAALSSLADAHTELANHDRALALLELLAKSEHDTRWRQGALIRIGDLWERMGEYAKALATWTLLLHAIQSAIDKGERSKEYGGESRMRFDELRTMRKIASLHHRMGDATRALEWAERALGGFRNIARNPPPRTPLRRDGSADGAEGQGEDGNGDGDDYGAASARVEVLRTVDFMSGVNHALGRMQQAIAQQREAAEGFERELGPTARLSLAAALDLAEMYGVMEERDKAIEWYNKALRGYETSVNEAHPQMRDGEARRVAVLGKKLGVAQDPALQ